MSAIKNPPKAPPNNLALSPSQIYSSLVTAALHWWWVGAPMNMGVLYTGDWRP